MSASFRPITCPFEAVRGEYLSRTQPYIPPTYVLLHSLVHAPWSGPLSTSPSAGLPCSSIGCCCTSDPAPCTGPLSALPPRHQGGGVPVPLPLPAVVVQNCQKHWKGMQLLETLAGIENSMHTSTHGFGRGP